MIDFVICQKLLFVLHFILFYDDFVFSGFYIINRIIFMVTKLGMNVLLYLFKAIFDGIIIGNIWWDNTRKWIIDKMKWFLRFAKNIFVFMFHIVLSFLTIILYFILFDNIFIYNIYVTMFYLFYYILHDIFIYGDN